jgi:hypothetical protein
MSHHTTTQIDTFDTLRAHPAHILLETVAGSQAYGTAHAQSDVDLRGVYVLPRDAYLALTAPIPQVSDARSDVVFYSLRRFLELAGDSNPTALEMLYSPQDCIRQITSCAQPLLEQRNHFVTRRAVQGFLSFAQVQIKKAQGRNKWINRPQPETPPEKEAFCWFIPRSPAPDAMPCRPIPLDKTDVRLAECHAASLEHVPDTFRLYHFGPGARGVFRDGNLVCESISREDEDSRCIGMLVYNRGAYEVALRDHHHYWIWRRERNETRWLSQESGALDYDAKNMMHTFRLLFSSAHMLAEGSPLVRVEGEQRAFLLAVRQGDFTYEDLAAQAEERVADIESKLASTTLPEAPQPRAADSLLCEITAAWESNHG